jgi:class 3 adenylate cyclase
MRSSLILAGRLPGGTGDFHDAWIKGGYPSRTIELGSLRRQILDDDNRAAPISTAGEASAAANRVERQIRSMLFADVKDFSKLREEYSPRFFLRFLEEVDGVLRSLKSAPAFSNTWGDGLFLVFHGVTECAEAALRLLERTEQVNWKELGFAETMPVRIGIHAGPVFSGQDPIIGRRNYFGSHVNRAARIEPVTMPGCAYTSEQFAGLLAVEGAEDFACEYLGVERLAKEYDRCPLYRLARR